MGVEIYYLAVAALVQPVSATAVINAVSKCSSNRTERKQVRKN
jgi:hypothetical protein